MFADADIDGVDFERELIGLLTDAGRRDAMRAAAHGLVADRAAEKLADEIEALRA